MKPKLIIILGPTAVGKSALALELAAELGAEIINADSQQVYRYMNIATGKPSQAERIRVPHHLIDIVDPDQEFNAAMFRAAAMERIRDIHSRKKIVIVCGGTGLYLRALTNGLFVGPGQEPGIRKVLEQEIQESGIGVLYQRLQRIDPSVTSRIHPNDRQRIVRALEVYQLTGKPMSEWQREHGFREYPFDTLKVGLNRERNELYNLIERRCDRMIQDGLLDEVRGLVAGGYSLNLKPLQSVGYRQVGLVLQGSANMADAVEEMKQETRRYAKRQLTWFRRDEAIRWFHPEDQKHEVIEAVKRFLD